MSSQTVLPLRPMFMNDNAICQIAWSLCAIATDLHLEMRGISAEVVSDDQYDFHRRQYFFRGNLRSLYSAHKLLTQLRGNVSFGEIARRHGQDEAFEASRRQVSTHADEFNGYRNRFGAHLERDVGESLALLPPDAVLRLTDEEVAELPRGIGVLAHLSAVRAEIGVAPERENDAFRQMLLRMRSASENCIRCINTVVAVVHAEFGSPAFRE